MQNILVLLRAGFVALVSLLGLSAGFAQPVIHSPNPVQSLEEQWKWALAEGKKLDGDHPFWIGYSTVRMMGINSFTGSYCSDPAGNKPSLCEQLELPSCVKEESDHGKYHSTTLNDGSTYLTLRGQENREVPKEVGILVEWSGGQSSTIADIVTSNFSLHVNLRNDPVYWLGKSNDTVSALLLESMYAAERSENVQEDLISTIGMHAPTAEIVSFLSTVLASDNPESARKQAAFWLGQSNSEAALTLLEETVKSDKSSEVRERAIFGISQMEGDKAIDALIVLAKNGNNGETREKAMFWLGQKASKKAVAALEQFAGDNDNTEVQKHAVFALTQLPDDGGVEALIKIAHTHPNPEIRKQAIFWLGQSDDDRALNALIEIIHQQ